MPKPITCRIGSITLYNFAISPTVFNITPQTNIHKNKIPRTFIRGTIFSSMKNFVINHPFSTLFHDLHQRQKYNLKILFQTSIIYILHVIPYLIRHNLLHISPVRITCLSQDCIFIRILDRSIICYTRSNSQHFTLLNSIHIHVLSYLRPWSHQTHLPSYHVQQLR
mgnify:CR=1 FL=1